MNADAVIRLADEIARATRVKWTIGRFGAIRIDHTNEALRMCPLEVAGKVKQRYMSGVAINVLKLDGETANDIVDAADYTISATAEVQRLRQLMLDTFDFSA
jgi:hypothetical protein